MYGHRFYERVFELLLRLKANYLWPAMWNNAFNEDDPENPKLADEYGIVMGTSHQEPMLRAQKEWDRRYLEDARHVELRNARGCPGIVLAGRDQAEQELREHHHDGTPRCERHADGPRRPEANRALLERIVGVQRTILAQEEMNRDVTQVPQAWCLYKEVLEFYNAGMRVPDDVTLLWPDDNWGNVRRLPTAEERKRRGGAGIYYHFDYHGGPRSYQWINANPIPKIWDQMSLARSATAPTGSGS